MNISVLRSWFTRILSMAFFYFGWILCLHQSQTRPYDGPIVVALMFGFQLYFTKNRLPDIVLVLTAMLMGTIVDSLYAAFGLIEYKSPYPFCPWIAPLWVAAVWVLYAMCLNHSLLWLRKWWWISPPLGAGGAFFSYLAGVKLGSAVLLQSPLLVYGIISAVWAVVTPLSLFYTEWVNAWCATIQRQEPQEQI